MPLTEQAGIMDLANRRSRNQSRNHTGRCTHWRTADRIEPLACATRAPGAATLGIRAVATHGFTADGAIRPGVDFSVFRTASDPTRHGPIASIHGYSIFSRARFGADRHHGFLSWRYAPTLLSFVASLSLVPFLPAFSLFFAGSFLCHARAVDGLSGLRACVARRAAVAGREPR
jgi:hypothetical protein